MAYNSKMFSWIHIIHISSQLETKSNTAMLLSAQIMDILLKVSVIMPTFRLFRIFLKS